MELEHRRLVLRARRLGQVLATLNQRQSELGDATPAGLRAALADFGRELADVRLRLRDLDRDVRSVQVAEA